MIRIELARDAVRPGELLQGEIRWDADAPPGPATLSLFWNTEGFGTVDVEIVAREQIALGLRSGGLPFRFKLPASPWSFSGRLVSLLWGVELAGPGLAEPLRRRFTLAPEGRAIDLTAEPSS